MKRLRLVALLAVFGLLGSACSVFGGDGTYEISVEFTRTFNLFPGSPVRVLGVEAGKVRDLHISTDSDVVTVDLLVDDQIQLPEDVSAVVIPASLLGERYVQLVPPYEGGPTFEAGGTIPVTRTEVPAEFDEVLESLNTFVGGLDENEFSRMLSNVADVVDGQGEALGRTIDNAHEAVGVLRENDEALISLASRLSDLNETLATRDQALGGIIEDWNTVAASLVDDRQDIDAALSGLVRLTRNLAGILEAHRTDLQDDIATLTRVGRTANRNLDMISLSILSSAELFRHAERVVSRTNNWLPLVNHSDSLANEVATSISDRLAGVCTNLGVPSDVCDQIALGDAVPDALCLDPIIPCPTGEDAESMTSVGEALRNVLEEYPALADALRRQGSGDDPDDVARDLAGVDDDGEGR